MVEIALHPARVDGNSVLLSWDAPAGFFTDNGYRVRYPDLSSIDASPGKLAESYFPVCLALSALGEVRFRLPAEVDPSVLAVWHDVIETTARHLFRRETRVEFVCDPVPAGYKTPGERTALYYGGGVESLLTLGRLTEEGQKPVLVSLGGPAWAGSNPDENPDKFAMDAKISSELGLELLRVRTDFREKILPAGWNDLVRPGFSVLNSVVALPSFLSFALPVVEQLGVRRLVSGNEMTDYDEEYFCFSPRMTDRLTSPASGVAYSSYLGDLLKEDVCHELYRHYPHLTKYQYSCWKNLGERWCLECSKCMQYLMLLHNNGIDPAEAGMDPRIARRNMNRMAWAVACSPEGRKGEIWERIVRFPRLRAKSELRWTLDRIRRRSLFWHGVAEPVRRRLPQGVRAAFQPLRALVTEGRLTGRAMARLKKLYRLWHETVWLARFDLWVATGLERHGGGNLSFVYGGDEPHLNYLGRTAFLEGWRAEKIGRAWAWNVGRTARCRAPQAAFLVLELSDRKEKVLRGIGLRPRFRVPIWLRVEVDLLATEENSRVKDKKRNMRRTIRNSGFESEVTKDPARFEDFYRNMHLPYIRGRHGEGSVIREWRELLAHFKNHCELLLVKTEGKAVGGVVIDYSEETPKGLIMGVLDGDESWLSKGLSDAIFYFKLEHLRSRGAARTSLGHSRPYLRDGALQYKRRLGGVISPKIEAGFWAIGFLKDAPALRSFLLHNPFVAVENGKLRAVNFCATAPEPGPAGLEPFLADGWFEGLPHFDLFAFEGLNGHEPAFDLPAGPKRATLRKASLTAS